MKELKKLIQEQNYIEAKLWIIENKERIDEVADCLLEMIEKRKNKMMCFSTPYQEDDLHDILSEKPAWKVVNESSGNFDNEFGTPEWPQLKKEDNIVNVSVTLHDVDPCEYEKTYEWIDEELIEKRDSVLRFDRKE